MRLFRLILTFYRSYFFASFMITMASAFIIYVHGLKALGATLGIKVITLAVIFLFINNYKKPEFFYYQNLGLSKKKLWASSLCIDMFIFFALITLSALSI